MAFLGDVLTSFMMESNGLGTDSCPLIFADAGFNGG
jgi:hypothetical protein